MFVHMFHIVCFPCWNRCEVSSALCKLWWSLIYMYGLSICVIIEWYIAWIGIHLSCKFDYKLHQGTWNGMDLSTFSYMVQILLKTNKINRKKSFQYKWHNSCDCHNNAIWTYWCPNHQQLDCLSNSSFMLTMKKSKLFITGPLWG